MAINSCTAGLETILQAIGMNINKDIEENINIKTMKLAKKQITLTSSAVKEKALEIAKNLRNELKYINRCSIYKVRPKACLEYPHTNRRKQYQILKLHTFLLIHFLAILDNFLNIKKF